MEIDLAALLWIVVSVLVGIAVGTVIRFRSDSEAAGCHRRDRQSRGAAVSRKDPAGGEALTKIL